MNLYVIRHGKTDWNLESRMQGQSNTRLNQIGIEQADKVRKIIEEKNIDLIISSPLERTKQTAEIINKNMNKPIEYNEKIMERNFGILEGKIANQIKNLDDYFEYHQNKEVEKGEKIQDFVGRVFEGMEQIEKEHKNKNILLVTHGGVARAIDYYFNGIPEERDVGKGLLSNCEIREYKK